VDAGGKPARREKQLGGGNKPFKRSAENFFELCASQKLLGEHHKSACVHTSTAAGPATVLPRLRS
jgi:hypothetical protein